VLLFLYKPKTNSHAFTLLVITNLFHVFEEYLGNTTVYSIEGIILNWVYPLLNVKYEPDYSVTDHDSIQNSLGDILSGFVGTLFIFAYNFMNLDIHKLLSIYLILLFPILVNVANRMN
jgi:hypothetical protein